jgi:hypothetical protein
MVFVLDPDLEGVFNLSNKQSIIDWQNLLDTLKDFASLPQTVQEAVRSLA